MKKLYISLILSFILGIGSFLYLTKPCLGALCLSGLCFSSYTCGGDGCLCLKKGLEVSGECYSAGRADNLIKQGWQHLE